MGESQTARELRRSYDQVFRFVRRRTASDDEAADVTQTVFAQAADRLDRSRGAAPPNLAWLYTVARRRLIDEARRRQRIGSTAALEEDAVFAADERRYGTSVADALRLALDCLPVSQRQVVLRRLIGGLSFQEIATELEMTQTAVRMRFFRGLATVRRVFEEEGIES